jgi:hypothetical protein
MSVLGQSSCPWFKFLETGVALMLKPLFAASLVLAGLTFTSVEQAQAARCPNVRALERELSQIRAQKAHADRTHNYRQACAALRRAVRLVGELYAQVHAAPRSCGISRSDFRQVEVANRYVRNQYEKVCD